VRKTVRVVLRGFIRLYCYQKKQKGGKLDAYWFLKKYFKKYSKNGFLPRNALSKSLKKALPKGSKSLKRRINRLKLAWILNLNQIIEVSIIVLY